MDLRESIGNQTDVALALSKNLISIEAKDKNLVFSPLSIHVVLSLIAAGSQGPTLEQLLSFLKSKSNEHLNSFCSEIVSIVFADGSAIGGPRLSFANGVWVDNSLSLKHSFKQVLVNVYKAASNQVDFKTKAVEVTGEVNSWAEKETNGLIKEVLPHGSVDSMTKLIFASALYFKGSWNEKFDASKTKDHDFYLLSGSTVTVPFMASEKKQLVRAFDGFKVLGLPYKQEKVGSDLGFLNHHLPYERVELGVFKIPRFKILYGFEASNFLKGLGLVLPFSEGGLTEMVDSPDGSNLHVSSIFHKSFIEVNEEGTEAAAASAGVIALRGLRFGDKIDFVADHPFLFLIREDMTGVVLFVGNVLNPLVS
ncbi:Serpin domain-containing protein [Cephalotus follicularis]|uniref:Serpin domain-containing protein n=1 Tax=Cephalotus follicularis TaxID=3775 RepID=A0A1Q3CTZ6_CEPFO|nr:Serpin domain-containing protein [Cephalotus follicularis]